MHDEQDLLAEGAFAAAMSGILRPRNAGANAFLHRVLQEFDKSPEAETVRLPASFWDALDQDCRAAALRALESAGMALWNDGPDVIVTRPPLD